MFATVIHAYIVFSCIILFAAFLCIEHPKLVLDEVKEVELNLNDQLKDLSDMANEAQAHGLYDEKFVQQMKIAQKIMREDRNVLKAIDSNMKKHKKTLDELAKR